MSFTMIRNKIFLLSIITLVAVALTGCFDENEPQFEEQQLEWEPIDRSTNDLDTTVELEVDQTEADTVTLRIQYAGEQQSEDLEGTFEVHEDTDATEGEQFEVLTESPVTIPANSNFSEEIDVEIDADQIQDGEETDIILEITDDGDIPPMENYNQFVIEIEKGE